METKAASIQKRFSSLAMQDRLPHAVLLEGGSERELLRLASQIAMAAVCTDGKKKPCGKCADCGKVKKGLHPDVITVAETDKKRKTISVDLIRRVREDVIVKPNEAGRKVYIIPNAGTMTREAQNALLKVLEEPPAYALFLLLCTRATELLATIRSRSQIYSLEETPALTDSVTELAASIAKAVVSPHEAALVTASAPLIKSKDREKFDKTLASLELILRDSCVLRSGGTTLLSGEEDAAAALKNTLPRRTLLRLLEEVQQTREKNQRNLNLALLITCLCAHLYQIAHR